MRDGAGMFALASLPRCATRWLIERALPKFPDTLVPKAIHGIVTPEMVIDEVEQSNAAHVALIGGGSLKMHIATLRCRWPLMRVGLLLREPADNIRSMIAKLREDHVSMLGVPPTTPLPNPLLALDLADRAATQIDHFLALTTMAGIEITTWPYPRYTTPVGMRELAQWAGLDLCGAEVAVAQAPFNVSRSTFVLPPEIRERVRQIFYKRLAVKDCYKTLEGVA